MFKWINKKLNKALCYVGIDIGTTGIKSVEVVRRPDKQVELLSYGAVPLPAGAVIEKTIKDPAVVATAIPQLLQQTGVATKNAVMAIADSTVVTKVLQFEQGCNARELEQLIMMEAERHIPHPIEEIYFDFQVLGESAHSSETMSVLLVASRKQQIDLRCALLADSGLTLSAIDLDSRALARACNFTLPPRDQVVAILDIGATLISLIVLQQNKVLYSHSESFAGPQALVLQVRRALQFFMSTGQQVSIVQLLLTGGVALLSDLAPLMTAELGIPTCVVNPFNEMRLAENIVPSALNKMAPVLMLSCGLALWSEGE